MKQDNPEFKKWIDEFNQERLAKIFCKGMSEHIYYSCEHMQAAFKAGYKLANKNAAMDQAKLSGWIHPEDVT